MPLHVSQENPLSAVAEVGAPLLQPYPPALDSAAGRFDHWVEGRSQQIADIMQTLTFRWSPLAAFLVVLFDHPDDGPCGALMMTTSTVDLTHKRERLRRLSVIPLRELTPYVDRWQRGGTVVASVSDMPENLSRRYLATQVEWSLNIPIRCEGEWVGIIGATADREGFEDGAITSFEAAGMLLEWEYAAQSAWYRFQDSLDEFESGAGRVSRSFASCL